MKPLISVVVPVYNVERYVEASVRSVLAQKYSNLECICVDDGATDRSGKILDELAKTDPRVIVIHQKNAGLGAARNTGLKHVRGQFVSFLDSDDLIEKDFLQEALDDFSRFEDLDVWMGQMLCVDDNNRPTVEQPPMAALANTTKPLLDLSHGNGRFYLFSACAKLFRMSLLSDDMYRFPTNVKFGEDWPFMTKVYSGARRVIVRENSVYRRRLHAGTIIGMSLASRIGDYITNIEMLLQFAKSTHRESTVNCRLAYSALGRFHEILLARDLEDAKNYAKALCTHPNFRKTILETIVRSAAQFHYRLGGRLLRLLPNVLIEKLLVLMWRLKRRK